MNALLRAALRNRFTKFQDAFFPEIATLQIQKNSDDLEFAFAVR